MYKRQDRTWFSVGADYSPNGDMSISVGYSYIDIDNARIDLEAENATDTGIEMDIDGGVNIIAIKGNYIF